MLDRPKSLAGAALVGMMIVVPAFAHGDDNSQLLQAIRLPQGRPRATSNKNVRWRDAYGGACARRRQNRAPSAAASRWPSSLRQSLRRSRRPPHHRSPAKAIEPAGKDLGATFDRTVQRQRCWFGSPRRRLFLRQRDAPALATLGQ